MPFTEQGYETRRFPDILESIRSSLENELGTPISSDPSTIIGILNSIYSNQVSTVENQIQALSNNLDIYKAEGVYLDRLAAYLNLRRLDAQPARGLLKVTRNSTTTISSSTLYATTNGLQFTCPQIVSSASSCNDILLDLPIVTQGNTYALTVNGFSISKVSSPTDTKDTILDYFVSEISSILGLTTQKTDGALFISIPDEQENSLSVTSLNNFTVKEISTFNPCESVLAQFLQVPINVITTQVSQNNTIIKVNNPLDFVSGRDLETDEDFRGRYERSLAIGGTSTFNNILSRLLSLPNVVDALILENTSTVEDTQNNLPPKSYSCIVVEGNDENIANTIWETKPLGIETVGSITSLVKDNKGNTQSVNWDRPEDTYIFLRLTYSKYSEEVFPVSGESLIREALLEYGRTLFLDDDVIPERFYGGVYRAVDGVGSLSLEVGYSNDPNDISPIGGYQSTSLPIGIKQLPIFTNARIELVETV